jgi:hypothetical protein
MNRILSLALVALQLLWAIPSGNAQVIPFGYWQRRGVIQKGSAATAVQATASNIVLNKPTTVQQGDVIYAFIWVDYYGALGTVSTPSGWTQLGFTALSSQYALYAFRRISDGTDGSTYTFSFSASADYSMGSVIAYANVNATAPEDATPVFSQGVVASTTVAVSGITTVSPYAQILVAVVDTSNDDTLSTPTGFTEKWLNVDTAHSQTIAGYDQLMITPGATGSISTSGWSTSTNKYQSVVIAIRSRAP